jgi:hypothetical protein
MMHGEDLSTSEDEDGNKKSGYELTDYMKEYNAKTTTDFTKGYEPKKLDDDYKNFKIWDKKTTTLPYTYQDRGPGAFNVPIPPEIKYELGEMFAKLEQNQFEAGKVFPKYVIE